MRSIRKHLGVLFAAALTLSALGADDKPAATNAPAAAGATPKIEDLFPDTVVAKGKGFEIKRSQLDEAIAGVRATAVARGQQISASDLPMIEKTSFDHLLQVQLLKGLATDADKTKATDEADKRLELIKKRAPSEDALAKQLKSMNLTVETLRARLIEEAVAEQVLRDKVNVTDSDVKQFYDDNPSQFEEAEMAHGYHILVATVDKTGTQLSDDDKKAKRKIADGLLKRIKDGEDFSKVAREFSDDPSAKENGGEFSLPRGRMPREFEAAVFTMETNQVSDVVTSQLGYHIIKLVEKIPAKKLEYAKVTPDIKNYLETVQMEKILPNVTAQLQKDANVQILDEEVKSIEEQAAAAEAAAAASPSGAAPKMDAKPAGKKP